MQLKGDTTRSRMIGQSLLLLGRPIPRISLGLSWPRSGRDHNCEAERRLSEAPVNGANDRLEGATLPFTDLIVDAALGGGIVLRRALHGWLL